MNKFLSHYSAALYWNIPYIDAILDIKANELEALDFTYFLQDKRYFPETQRQYICKLPLPAGAVILRDDIYVASPELVFLQLANKLDIHRCILLGLQLCSHSPGKTIEAITTKQKLNNFVIKMEGHRG